MKSNMNWYQLYKQASPPLPVIIPDGEWPFMMCGGADRIDSKMSAETAEKEKQRLNSPSFLGEGSSGFVVDTNDGYVTKYVMSPSDADLAMSLIGETKYPIAKVRSVDIVQHSPMIWAISLEKVEPYQAFDPYFHKWSDIKSALFSKLSRIGLSWDIGPNNVGWNSDGKPVLFDLGAWM